MIKEKLIIKPNPNKVLIKISKSNWNSIFSKWIKMPDGKQVEIFIDIEEASGFERKFQQNTSVGLVVGVGENVEGVMPGDMAIIDYTVTGGEDCHIGYVNGELLVAIDANSTYHKEDSVINLNGMNTYKKGDPEEISFLYGIVRNKVAYSRDPYIFLFHENPLHDIVDENGVHRQIQDEICTRTVMASFENSIAKAGDRIKVNSNDIFERVIDNRTLSVIFKQDLIAVL